MFVEPLFLKFFAALFAIMNPFTNLPIFLSLTSGKLAGNRVRIATTMAMGLIVLLTAIAIIGPKFLSVLGINLPSFEIAGGIIVFLIALSMLHAKQNTMHNITSEEKTECAARTSPALVPLTMPLLGGPGAITAVLIYTSKIKPDVIGDYITVYSVIYLMVFFVWAAFCLGNPIAKILGYTGMNVITRVMAIILASLGVEMITDGIFTIFH